MSRKRKFFAALVYGAMLLGSTSLVFAQEKRRMIERQPERIGPETQPLGDNVVFVSSEMGFSFDGKVVKGAPYSGQAVTETTQILGDGNRIVNRNAASVYRDREGRTRHEQTIAAIGPFGEIPHFISINDPVAGVSYVFEPNSRVARKLNSMQFEFKLNANDEKDKAVLRDKRQGSPGSLPEGPKLQVGTMGPSLTVELADRPDGNRKQESLGKQIIEGVEAEGTRMTITIPAGEIGNERAIEIVSERWYSPELQTVVITKHSDPRLGETIYRLTNINRGEQDASLFRVPSDYRIEEAPMPPMPMRIRMPNEQ
jgi:hypothetical protein